MVNKWLNIIDIKMNKEIVIVNIMINGIKIGKIIFNKILMMLY